MLGCRPCLPNWPTVFIFETESCAVKSRHSGGIYWVLGNRVLVCRVKIVFYVRTRNDRDLQRALKGVEHFQFVIFLT